MLPALPGRIFTHQQAHAAGFSMAQLTDEVRAGRLFRPRRGFYAVPDAPADLVRAVRVGGSATAATALRTLGVWTAPDDRLHVRLPPHTGRRHHPDHPGRELPPTSSVCLHWTSRFSEEPTPLTFTACEPLLTALEHALDCWPAEFAIAAVDSALHLEVLPPAALRRLRHGVPPRHRSVLNEVDGRAESGTESITRVRLRRKGLQVEPLVRLPRVGTVDLVVEGRLVVEVDGREFHSSEDRFEEDRRRDAHLAALGYRVLRFSYRQVLYDWPSVERAILAALADAA
jgi:very-short-patch-repair endonuclease